MKRVCVIGAGASGLPAIKCCLDENIVPVCYEKASDIGGLWNYEGKKEGSSIYKSLLPNTSKEEMSYSDFPMPKEYPNFMPHTKYLEYFRKYAKQFNLLEHIHFDTEVVQCKFAEDYDDTGRWKVTVKDRKSGDESTEYFDGILICAGHHDFPNYPTNAFPGFDKFKGDAIHSQQYKEPSKYEGKRVVVVGAGNSGGDIAVELGNNAKKVYFSTRRGSWVLSRLVDNGIPIGYAFTKRFSSIMENLLPLWWRNYVVEKQLNRNFDHAAYAMKPDHRIFSQHPLVNDHLPYSIISGLVTVKGNIREFTENGVVFEDGEEEKIDAVVFCTGYNIKFPYLDESIIKVRENELRLFRYMWPPHLKHNSLAVIGCIQPRAPLGVTAEMQCRWATRVFNGVAKLPARQKMDEIIDHRLNTLRQVFYKSPRQTLEVEYIPYMDCLADEIGVKPDLWKLFKEDFELAWKVLFKHLTPYQYRLMGPGAWSGARQAIMTQSERMRFPLATRKVTPDKGWWYQYVIISVFVLLLVYLFF